MKKLLFIVSMALVASSPAIAQVGKVNVPVVSQTASVQRTIPIASDETITEAPAGRVVQNAIRKGYSYFYSNGNVLGGYNDTFVGEFVVGDDGNIYIKNACASIDLGSYLKLEKVDDETYVAHTAQLIWYDDSEGTPFTAFATRLVYVQKGPNSYGFEVEKDENGNPLCDVYFTYKDGVLKQQCQETVTLNGEVIPRELIGFTNSDGGWIGFGDACMEIEEVSLTPTALPAEAEVKPTSFAYQYLSGYDGKGHYDAFLLDCAEVGDRYYVASPEGSEGAWIVGDIDRAAGTVTFKQQYIGLNVEKGVHQWFMPVKFTDVHDIWDEETGFGEWRRDATKADALVLKYNDGRLVADEKECTGIGISRSEQRFEEIAKYTVPVIMPYSVRSATPAVPVILDFEEFNGLWSEINVCLTPTDEELQYLDKDELYFTMYLGSEEPFEFTVDAYDCAFDMTEFPYKYRDNISFETKLATHWIAVYDEYEYFGVQAIHRHNGEEKRSDIVWYNHTPDGILNVVADYEPIYVKCLEDGRVVLRGQQKTYNTAGQHIK